MVLVYGLYTVKKLNVSSWFIWSRSCLNFLRQFSQEREKGLLPSSVLIKAKKHPSKYLTIIDDAMDQKTTCIPRVRRKTKATCNLATVGTHLVGAIFHSGQSPNGKDVLGSFDYYQWPHDPNLTASVLLAMLVQWCEKKELPPVLHLQLDNCVKENKNQYILWLLALLVELKIFEKVKFEYHIGSFRPNGLHYHLKEPGFNELFSGTLHVFAH